MIKKKEKQANMMRNAGGDVYLDLAGGGDLALAVLAADEADDHQDDEGQHGRGRHDHHGHDDVGGVEHRAWAWHAKGETRF